VSDAGVVRELVARFSFQMDDKSVSKADAFLDGLTEKVTAVGGAIAAMFAATKIAEFVGQTITMADELNDAAEHELGRVSESMDAKLEPLRPILLKARTHG